MQGSLQRKKSVPAPLPITPSTSLSTHVTCLVWPLQEAKQDCHDCIANNLLLGASKSCLIMQ